MNEAALKQWITETDARSRHLTQAVERQQEVAEILLQAARSLDEKLERVLRVLEGRDG